jgi:hypothetical protein
LPITEQHTEESLCFAHIYALAGIAGVNYSIDKYDYGIDGHFVTVVRRGSRLVDSGFALDFQAKAQWIGNWSVAISSMIWRPKHTTISSQDRQTPRQ